LNNARGYEIYNEVYDCDGFYPDRWCQFDVDINDRLIMQTEGNLDQ
jgi:hypothetical protein